MGMSFSVQFVMNPIRKGLNYLTTLDHKRQIVKEQKPIAEISQNDSRE